MLTLRPIAAAALSGLFALLLALAPAAARADGYVTVSYVGTYDESFIYQPQDPSVWQSTMHLSWNERETFRVAAPGELRSVGSPVFDVGGKVSSIYAPPNTFHDCSFSVVPRPRAPSPTSAYWDGRGPVGGTAEMPTIGRFVASTGETSSEPGCGISPDGGVGIAGTPPDSVLGAYGRAEIVDLNDELGGPPATIRFDADGRSDNGQTTASIHAVMTVSNTARPPAGGGSGTPPSGGRGTPPRLTPARKQAKLNALDAIRDSMQRALYPCGVGSGVGTALIAAGPVGLAVGGTMTALGTPLCLAYLKTIRDEADTVADPPARGYRRAARIQPVSGAALRLPACPPARGAGSPGAVCRRLAPAAQRLLAATRATGAAAAALDTTISRETAALAAGDRRAIALQDRTLASLGRDFAARRRAETAAARGVARILRSARLDVRLDPTAAATALARLQQRLAAAGLPAAKLRTALGGPPQVTAFDLLTALDQ